MPRRWLALLASLAIAAAVCPAVAQPALQSPPAAAAAESQFVASARTVTLRFSAGGQDFAYSVRAAWQPVPNAGGTANGEIFHVDYTREDAGAAPRPILFAFNGGPGAASVYLHLAAMGPRRAALAADGTAQAGQPTLVDNAESWLGFADLVFVDPVGTGLSRAVSADGSIADARSFWEVEADARAMARFVRDHLDAPGGAARRSIWWAKATAVSASRAWPGCCPNPTACGSPA